MVPSNYFAGSYWPASFFGQVIGVPQPPPPTDRQIFLYLVGLWKPLVGPIQYSDIPPGDSGPASWLLPWRWSESPDDDGDVRIRTVAFRLILAVGAPSLADVDPLSLLHDLASRCADALDRAPPPWCLSQQTRIAEAIVPAQGAKGLPVPAPTYPAQVIVCNGQFAYEVRAGRRLSG